MYARWFILTNFIPISFKSTVLAENEATSHYVLSNIQTSFSGQDRQAPVVSFLYLSHNFFQRFSVDFYTFRD